MNSEPEIIELLGKETTLKLERALGGQRKYIASNPTDESPIVAVIGMEAAQTLATRFGGMLLYIPQQMAARIRNQEIRLAVWAGEHKQAIGQRFGLVERTIRKVVQGDNYPRLGLTCRQLRAGVQGYLKEQGDERQLRPQNQQNRAKHGGIRASGHRAGRNPAQGELFGTHGEPVGSAIHDHEPGHHRDQGGEQGDPQPGAETG